MDEDTINLLKTIQSDIDILVEGTHPNVQRIPNMTAHCILKKIQVDLKKLDNNLFMKSKHLEGLL